MNREEAATIIKAIGKHAIETHLTDPGDIVDATVCGKREQTSANPCATCSNRDCANSLLAKWWDLCVESKFTLFKQIDPPLSGAIGPDAGERR